MTCVHRLERALSVCFSSLIEEVVVRSEPDLQDRIRSELEWDEQLDASDVDVDVTDGVVRLAGTVSSYAEKLMIQESVRWLDEVHDVVNDIVVRPDQLLARDDRDLRAIVENVLVWDSLVPDQTITVAVEDGWVTLSGTASVRGQRDEAERAIRHLVGIRGITNEIDISEIPLAPSDIRAVVADVLQRRARHSASRIDVTIDGHDVLLSGRVQSAMEKRALLGAVGHAPGVERVTDGLLISAD